MAGGDGSFINRKSLTPPHFQGRNVTDEQWEKFFPKKDKKTVEEKTDKKDVSV